ncbi:hypothetical protein N310_09441, partial [Acanthisitta chloris]
PAASATGIIGKKVLLPCHVAAGGIPEAFSVRWMFHNQSQKITISSYDGK